MVAYLFISELNAARGLISFKDSICLYSEVLKQHNFIVPSLIVNEQ